jgi:PAS domain S-box-containing protein
VNTAIRLDAYLILNILSAIFSAGLAIAAGNRKRAIDSRSFSMVLWMEFAWTVLLLGESTSTSYEAKLFWDNLHFAIPPASGALFLLFARAFTGDAAGSDIKRNWPLFIPALVSLMLAFTDPLHGLVRSAPFIDRSMAYGELVYGFTVFDYLQFAWIYALSVAAILILAKARAKVAVPYRAKYNLVILGYLIPLAGALLIVLDIRILGRRDFAPIWFMAGNIPVILAVFRFHLFDIMPRARRILVESLGDPIVVLDPDRLILDCNRAFAHLVGVPAKSIRGCSVPNLLAAWPASTIANLEHATRAMDMDEGDEAITVPSAGGDRSFKVKVTSIPGTRGESAEDLCKVAVFRDVTELASVERQLQAWNSELESRIRSRIKDLELEVSRRKSAEESLRKLNVKIVDSQREILVTLSEVVENRSPETANHVLRVGEYARTLASAYGLSPALVTLIADAAPLHDVGKIAIPDSILNKEGRLTEAEMTVMKTHSAIGYRILGSSERSIIRAAALMALEHHERWNGEGYPAGKPGENISLSGRIVCICDVFDALATSRPYKKGWEIERIIEYIEAESGRMFDPHLVALFIANQDQFREISSRYPDVPERSTSTAV